MTPTPADDVPPGLLERLLDGPALRPEAVAAGRRRLAAADPLPPEGIAAAVVDEGPPLVPVGVAGDGREPRE